ncbi:MAG: hypothetical protein QNJ57_02770 [Flavobacteriaceae bacterium]|nr:hypothetical protein [Flavobacteriaceae bacterium]
MKKILSLVLIAFFASGIYAQEQENQQRRKRPNFTAEQLAELQTKRMALDLELSDAQQEQIFEINKRNAIERKQKMEELKALKAEKKQLSDDQLFELKKAQLDRQLTHQNALKEILNDQQFETWKKTRRLRAHKTKRKVEKRRMMKRRMQHRKRAHDRR